MNAIELLDQQHDDVESLFARLRGARSPRMREALFIQIADQLAIHSTIEERHFYPALRARDTATDGCVTRAYDEHREVKLQLADLLDLDADHPEFMKRCAALENAVMEHIDEERGELFPRARRLCDDLALDRIANEMMATMTELIEEGEPRLHVREELYETQPTV
jgi:hemerythrin-like domain-containing protein